MIPVVEKAEVVQTMQKKLSDLGKPFMVHIFIKVIHHLLILSVVVNAKRRVTGPHSIAHYKHTLKSAKIALLWKVKSN